MKRHLRETSESGVPDYKIKKQKFKRSKRIDTDPKCTVPNKDKSIDLIKTALSKKKAKVRCKKSSDSEQSSRVRKNSSDKNNEPNEAEVLIEKATLSVIKNRKKKKKHLHNSKVVDHSDATANCRKREKKYYQTSSACTDRKEESDQSDKEVFDVPHKKKKGKKRHNRKAKHERKEKRRIISDVITKENNVTQRNKSLIQQKPDVSIKEEQGTSSIKVKKSKKIKNCISKKQTKKLTQLSVIMPWSTPPLHLIETKVDSRPSTTQKREIDDLNVVLKKTRFTKLEDGKIMHNWKKFCKIHDLRLNPEPFLSLTNTPIPSLERIKFVRFLAHGMEDRLLCSVYKRFQRIFATDEQKPKRVTPPESSKMKIILIKNVSNKTSCADLTELLHRNDLFDIKKKCTESTDLMVSWTKENVDDFMNHLMNVTEVDDLKELKSKEISSEQWKKMSGRLNVSTQQLQKAWLCIIYPRLFNKTPVLKILKYL